MPISAADSVNVIVPQERMPRREALLARFVGDVAENVQLACANSVLSDVLKGNFFNVFKLVGAMGSLYAMLAPYGIGYSLFAQDKMFARECLRRFLPQGRALLQGAVPDEHSSMPAHLGRTWICRPCTNAVDLVSFFSDPTGIVMPSDAWFPNFVVVPHRVHCD